MHVIWLEGEGQIFRLRQSPILNHRYGLDACRSDKRRLCDQAGPILQGNRFGPDAQDSGGVMVPFARWQCARFTGTQAVATWDAP